MNNLKTIVFKALAAITGKRLGLDFTFVIPFLLLSVLLASCGQDFTPRRRGFNRIDLPEPAYIQLDSLMPYTFEYNKAAIVQTDSSRHTEKYWVDIKYPTLGAEVELTYKPLNGNMKLLNELTEDARKLVSKHQIKASGIVEATVPTADGNLGFIFALSGQVPSQFQFYTSDSSANFLRGALYFRTATKNDSLQPVIDYISEDMRHLLSTLRWTNKKPAKQLRNH
ncbi:MAG: gliding motility lipoprotein GldD [Bacteroidota bacterium]